MGGGGREVWGSTSLKPSLYMYTDFDIEISFLHVFVVNNFCRKMLKFHYFFPPLRFINKIFFYQIGIFPLSTVLMQVTLQCLKRLLVYEMNQLKYNDV